MRILTNLQYLNGLPVERDMLEESQESEQQEVFIDEVSAVKTKESSEDLLSEEV